MSSVNNGFLEYNQKLFSWEDQERLAEYLLEIKKRKAFFIMTNAKDKYILKMYSHIAKPIIITRFNKIGGIGASRGFVKEYLFKNY